jgi:uridine kinase
VRSKFLGIAGGSCSGKTTLVNALAKTSFGSVSTVAFDSYYRDQGHKSLNDRALVNYDHPDSLDVELFVSDMQNLRDGKTIQSPVYDFSTHTRSSETQIVEPTDLVMLDGILLLAFSAINDLLDLRVFVDASESTRFRRRIPRDVEERGRTEAQSLEQLQRTVQPMHQKFVGPSIQYADLIIDGELNPKLSAEKVLTALLALD